jgi:hypothetical protein
VLLARGADHLLLFVDTPPTGAAALDGARALFTNWEAATPGYHLVERDPGALPAEFLWRVVAADTIVPFTPPPSAIAY